MSTTTTDFKAIIVGGGLSGLLAALSLRSAGFDFILLEQRDHIVVNEGASIALNAATLRILYQLGLLEACREAGHPLSRKCTFFLDGHVWNSSLFDIMQKWFVHNESIDMSCQILISSQPRLHNDAA